MLNRNLSYWIAESESWQSFVDFRLPDDSIADYRFIKTPYHFYMSLMSRAFDRYESRPNDEIRKEFLAIAKGLEIFSLPKTRSHFQGISHITNLLHVSGLYYLANYSASAFLQGRILSFEGLDSKIDEYLLSFLIRSFPENSNENSYISSLQKFLDTGDGSHLDELIELLNARYDESVQFGLDTFASYRLALTITAKFSQSNTWLWLKEQKEEVSHWKELVDDLLKRPLPIWDFFPSQIEALSSGILTSGLTTTLQMPTSSGKTAISELAIYDELKTKRFSKVLYLAPFRSLASELKGSFAKNLGRLGIKSKTLYGGNFPTAEEQNALSDSNMVIATPEKFMAIENVLPALLQEFSLVICDEGHLLDDQSRGLSYELLLSRFKSTGKCRFIFISAIIPNVDDINDWLGGTDQTVVRSAYRPTQLEFGFLQRQTSKRYYLNINPNEARPTNYQLYKFLTNEDFKFLNPQTNRINTYGWDGVKSVMSVAVSLKAVEQGSVALFAPQKSRRNGVEGLALKCKDMLEKGLHGFRSPAEQSNAQQLAELRRYFALIFGETYLLTELVEHGVLFHHGDLPQNVREVIEDSLRTEKIRLVICTNTLAEGVNLPIRTLVIHSTQRYVNDEKGWVPLKIRDLKNLVGRAGRAGKENKGFVLAPHSGDFEILRNLIDDSGNERVQGRLHEIVQEISDFLIKAQIQLSKEILDDAPWHIKQLFDSIDVSMIHLLGEEVELSDLRDKVTSLLEETLTYNLSNDNEKETARQLFELRSEELAPYIESNEFSTIKQSGVNLRSYNSIIDSFDWQSDLWTGVTESLNEDWLEFILVNGVFELDDFQLALENFNNANNVEVDAPIVLRVVKGWMSGKWYEFIASDAGLDIRIVLRLIHGFLGFDVSSLVGSIIRLRELRTESEPVSAVISAWPNFLQHGIGTTIQLSIIELGITDRLLVLSLSDWISQSGSFVSSNDLDDFIIDNDQEITSFISDRLPPFLIDKFANTVDILKIRNVG